MIFLNKGLLSSSGVHAELRKTGEDVSLVTVKRALSALAKAGYILMQGSGRTTAYTVTSLGRIFSDVESHPYCTVEPDKRYGLDRYNFHFLPVLPANLFSKQELSVMQAATAMFEQRSADLSSTLQKKELERLIIELSWKSSKIEGNTYTLLDTEKLILENKKAPGHDTEEAQMILNHKEAFIFVHDHAKEFKTLTRTNLEQVHSILTKGFSVGKGLRSRGVGVVGSKYRPLDNLHQIREAVTTLSDAVTRMATPYAKALVTLFGIAYIQPFEDGNKRTSRLMANALLLAHRKAPLSYRSVDENDYKEAMIVVYEINSIVPIKKIFMSQYEFSAENYVVK